MPENPPTDRSKKELDGSEDPELSQAELQGAKELLSQLKDRWHNADLHAFSKHYDEAADRSREADRTATDERLHALEAAYSLFLLAVAQNKLDDLLDRYGKEGIRIQVNSHPLHVILRARMTRKQDRARP